MFSQRWLDRFFFSSPWRFSSFTSTLAKPGTAQIAQKVICFFLKPNQQINGLTFINLNTLQIPQKRLLFVLQNSHSIFQSLIYIHSVAALHCHDHCLKIQIKSFAKFYFIQFHKALLLQGLFITGGTVGRWYVRPLPPFPIPSWSQVPQPSTEMFPATLCPVKPFPIPPHPIPPPPSPHNPLRFPKSKGLYGHSLSVVDNGRKLVACGGMTEQWIFGGIGIGFGDGGIDVVLYSSPEARTVCISWQDGQDGWTLDLKMM